MRRWIVILAGLSLSAGPGFADSTAGEDPRVAELERKVEVLTQEIESLKLGAVAETTRYESRRGLAPAASKVYGVSRGISLGGYGEMLFERFDCEDQDGQGVQTRDRIDFLRQVLYLGYKFDDRLLFNSELEIEHAAIRDQAEVQVDPLTGAGDVELSGEFGLEFAYVEWSAHRGLGLRAGMLLVPLGLTNEIHEPPTYLGARRPGVEQFIIPTTWRGDGAGLFGEAGPGFSWRAYLIEGLDGGEFGAASGIREGRQGGSQSVINRPALTARLDWSGGPGLLAGASVLTGDTWQDPQPGGAELTARHTLYDFHARLAWRGLEARGVWAAGRLEQAGRLSDQLGLTGAERMGERSFGGYLEGGYDVLPLLARGSDLALFPYARYEVFDTQENVPGGIENPEYRRRVLTLGLELKPHPNVVLKVEREERRNDAHTEVSQWNIALGYMF